MSDINLGWNPSSLICQFYGFRLNHLIFLTSQSLSVKWGPFIFALQKNIIMDFMPYITHQAIHCTEHSSLSGSFEHHSA